ncbi:surface protease GP63 [Trypanosoma theileri]|uniref:Leishmanolysin-like peptidase n=1 Tax=Trypanosoma theileri TaxID=67003 RepID=A0A1X0P801_9TRYP|nr:surface protease GP63 [Trypanosoma theileri]ORC93076.1 surface protease GP63 [Trypanosoma theileri]
MAFFRFLFLPIRFNSHNSWGIYRVYTEPDDCPFAKPEHVYTSNGMLSALCTLTVNNTIPGSVTGNDSWCLDGDSLKVKVKGSANKVVGGVCARVSCDEGKVKVMYAGNDTWHDCPEGGSLEPSTNSSIFAGGSIKCPKYSEVCTMTPDGGSRLIPKTSERRQRLTTNSTRARGGSRRRSGAGTRQSSVMVSKNRTTRGRTDVAAN